MKKVFFILVAFLASSFALAQDYPFSVVKSGTGKQAIVFIPGFACSGDVWKETVEVLKEDYTCYVLTVGLSESNIRVKIHRIKALLTKKMKEYGK